MTGNKWQQMTAIVYIYRTIPTALPYLRIVVLLGAHGRLPRCAPGGGAVHSAVEVLQQHLQAHVGGAERGADLVAAECGASERGMCVKN